MLPDRLELLGAEPARLVEDGVRHRDLPDVVQERRELGRVQRVRRQTERGADAPGERRHALRVPVRVAVLRVHGRRDRLHRVEKQPLEVAQQPHAVQGDAGLVAHRGEQLQIRVGEAAGPAHAVHVERAEDRVGRPERHAHDRPDPLLDHARSRLEAAVGAGVVREDRHALADDVGDERAAHREGRVPGAERRGQLHAPAVRAGDQQRGAVGARHLEHGVDDRIRQRGHVWRARQRLRDRVQGRQVQLGAIEQRALVAPVGRLEPVHPRRHDSAADDRLDAARIAAELRRPARRGRGALAAALELDRAHPEHVAGRETLRRDRPAVDERAVGRPEIGDRERVARGLDGAVTPRDRLVAQRHVAVRRAADDEAAAGLDRDPAPVALTQPQLESHGRVDYTQGSGA